MAELVSGEDDGRLNQLRETLDADPSNSSHHYDLGVFLWEKAEQSPEAEDSRRCYEASAERFLAAAKLNPSDAAAFRFLGQYYRRVAVDAQRAAKCYQRALALNPEDADSGEGLCDLLDAEGKESLELSVCKEACDKSRRAFWAYRRLGYLQVRRRKWTEAVQVLQHAIRGYPTCADLWEALGLSYQRLGMFTAAIKSYGRAIELEGSKIFSLTESGNIQLTLGYFRNGVEQLRCAVQLQPLHPSANFGLASGLLCWAKDCMNSGAFAWGATLLKEALNAAEVCVSHSGNLSSVWKLHGDIQVAYARCLPWEHENSSKGSGESSFKDSIFDWRSRCFSNAHKAKLSYQRALHLTPWEANIYTDAAISIDLVNSLEVRVGKDSDNWQLPEKVCIGGLLLEPTNKDLWLALGCLSSNITLKQHAFIRGLQLDVSLSEAWAHLGKIYKFLGDKQLVTLAFDRARSIDPSLPLPWAGLSVEDQARSNATESFESCLRAVQTLPLAEFQAGLGTIAARSGNLGSPQVFVAAKQAVQRAPFYPESHNIYGLASEAQSDYCSAAASYRNARSVLLLQANSSVKGSIHADISFNLARALCKAGDAIGAAQECEDLKNRGLLDIEGLQIYAVALWKLQRFAEALAVVKNLAENAATTDQTLAASAVGLISTLAFAISGKDVAADVIHIIPNQLTRSTRMKFIICALDAMQPSKRFHLPALNSPPRMTSYEVVSEAHSIIALGKMISKAPNNTLTVSYGVNYLKKALHMYPNSSLIRNQLSSILLSNGERVVPHKAVRCNVIKTQSRRGLKSAEQVQCAAHVACFSTGSTDHKSYFTYCEDEDILDKISERHLQRWVHREPWNQDAKYLLILYIFQKARAERFPKHLCTVLGRLISQALSQDSLREDGLCCYEKFILLVCSSEMNLQAGSFTECISSAKQALNVLPLKGDLFFAHLQLCRAYALQGDFPSLKIEYMKCLDIRTSCEIGWIQLKYLESSFPTGTVGDRIEMNLLACVEANRGDSARWASLFYLACAQCALKNQDYSRAQQALTLACANGEANSCILLCHGAICMELARQRADPQFISKAAVSLRKAQQKMSMPLPVVSLLLAQAEGSLGDKSKWARNLRVEWSAWPQEIRPAELYFQMHLLAKQPDNKSQGLEALQSPVNWVLRAIHMNPSCARYWKGLQLLMQS